MFFKPNKTISRQTKCNYSIMIIEFIENNINRQYKLLLYLYIIIKIWMKS